MVVFIEVKRIYIFHRTGGAIKKPKYIFSPHENSKLDI